MIQCENVSMHYANGAQALDNITFELEQGEMAFLTGHSGAGKSTLLNTIAKIENHTQGQMTVNGFALERLASRHIPKLRRSIGIISQNPNLLDDYTVFDNVALPLIITGAPPAQIQKRVRASLEKVGLRHKENAHPNTLSTGEQQRVSIARAVVHKPELLLADEPTGNLDPKLSAEIMHLFEQFHELGTTVLIASHDLGLIATMPHRMLRLKNGRLL